MVAEDSQANCRVVYVGTGRKLKFKFAFIPSYEGKSTWRRRLAGEMEETCRDMLQQGLHLTHVVPVTSSAELRGGWTEGAWLYFAAA